MPNITKTIKVKCPYCSREIPATILQSYGYQTFVQLNNYYICLCPMCDEIFFVKAIITGNSEQQIKIDSVYPYPVAEQIFPESIRTVSSKFEFLYNQALKAEHMNLFDVCGLAYRRSFEYLVRDFSCYLSPDFAEDIRQDNNFSRVIKNRIPENPEFQTFKSLSLAAWWIGSDYAHYSRKYSEFDITDLKTIIDILVKTIDTYISIEKYKQITKR